MTVFPSGGGLLGTTGGRSRRRWRFEALDQATGSPPSASISAPSPRILEAAHGGHRVSARAHCISGAGACRGGHRGLGLAKRFAPEPCPRAGAPRAPGLPDDSQPGRVPPPTSRAWSSIPQKTAWASSRPPRSALSNLTRSRRWSIHSSRYNESAIHGSPRTSRRGNAIAREDPGGAFSDHNERECSEARGRPVPYKSVLIALQGCPQWRSPCSVTVEEHGGEARPGHDSQQASRWRFGVGADRGPHPLDRGSC
jgi:hypothetical protein